MSNIATKLDPSQVRAICKLRATGARVKDLAARFGVSKSLISRITNGQRRKQVFAVKDYEKLIRSHGHDPGEVLTAAQAAALLGCDENAIAPLLRSGLLADLSRLAVAEIWSLFNGASNAPAANPS